jgi:hypothetical protein
MVMAMRRNRRTSAHLVTEAHRPKSEDISHRERRYLITMAIRVVCFVVAVVLFAQGLGWLAAIPILGAITIPYFAVVVANTGRGAASTKGFRAYEPRLPALNRPPGSEPADDANGSGKPGTNGRSPYDHRTEGR